MLASVVKPGGEIGVKERVRIIVEQSEIITLERTCIMSFLLIAQINITVKDCCAHAEVTVWLNEETQIWDVPIRSQWFILMN